MDGGCARAAAAVGPDARPGIMTTSDRDSELQRIRLHERIRASHGSMLLTLVSVVQGAVFSYLAYVLVSNGAQLSALGWFVAGISLVVIIMAWNEYFMGITSIVYVPDLLDSFFPFVMAVVQVWIVHMVDSDPRGWLIAMAGFSLLSSASFVNMYVKGVREAENRGLLRALGVHVYVSILLPFAGAPGFLLLYLWVDRSAASLASLAGVFVYGTLLLATYTVRSVLYWRRIVRYSRGDVMKAADFAMFAPLGASPALDAGGRSRAAGSG
jgi:hypothetical protein